MTPTASAEPANASSTRTAARSRNRRVLSLLGALWLLLFFASLFTPPVLDDADGTHANAARQMMLSGDWVTLRVNNVRYLEKAPLPYWIVAASLRVFGINAFAVHLPQALSVLLLMLLGVRWSREVFGERAALYTGLGTLTAAGIFLFTRVFIPDVLLSLLLACSLYCFLKALGSGKDGRAAIPTDAQGKTVLAGGAELSGETAAAISSGAAIRYAYAMWIALALAVLSKGLVAIVFLFGTVAAYLALSGELREWRRLKPFTGGLLFLAIAAPWHILAGLRNTGGMDGHGFFWFYFINEHVLRFLGRRIPRDYNKLPGYLYWSLNLVWLFPWAVFFPLLAIECRDGLKPFSIRAMRAKLGPAQRTSLLLAVFSALVLVFFSFSTNQEYYGFPTYLPLLMLLSAALARAEAGYDEDRSSRRWIAFAHASFTFIGAAAALALAYGLWVSRRLASAPDIGDLLAHRGVGHYTLSMSGIFDLTGRSFAALRLPAAVALAVFAIGPAVAWSLRGWRPRCRDRHLAATIAIALTSALFLVAAHMALARFAPMLSSRNFAVRIQQLEAGGAISRDNTLLFYGDQAYGSSLPFYLDRPLDRPALLVDGRSSSMLFGSTFADAQGLFLTPAQLLAQWGTGPRKLLFVPLEHRDDVDRLLGDRQIVLEETAGKALVTDRPLDRAATTAKDEMGNP